MPTKTLTLDGNNIHDIPSFYAEINRVFMANEDWQLGPSLDALDDMLYGAYGAAHGQESIVLIWRNMEKNRADLGIAATREYYLEKLKHPDQFNVALFRKNLESLENGTGATYFDTVQQIIADHPNITLRSQDDASSAPR
ncbi:barstar family protein [Bordetella muralis]|jgi:RNAse (barnase) inhibitor barstar|uniref:barstar family protein n=1 Tax=Bordetella muralis TaxID=1649130 RepID=UPI0039F04075